MPTEETTESEDHTLFGCIKISVVDSVDRADLWMEISRELIRLGFLASSLRAPTILHNHIHSAATICKSEAEREIERSDHYLGVLNSYVTALKPHSSNEIDLECADAK